MTIAWTPLIIAVYGIAGIVGGIIAWVVASRKRRDRQSWAFATFFFPPAVLILFALKPLRISGPAVRYRTDDDGDDEDGGDGQAVNTATRYITGA
jgi:hypothetical protein